MLPETYGGRLDGTVRSFLMLARSPFGGDLFARARSSRAINTPLLAVPISPSSVRQRTVLKYGGG